MAFQQVASCAEALGGIQAFEALPALLGEREREREGGERERAPSKLLYWRIPTIVERRWVSFLPLSCLCALQTAANGELRRFDLTENRK